MTHPLLQPLTTLVIGHRGSSMFSPENTVASISQAVERGADAVEIDVHLSADGEAVVIHDPTVERTTDGQGAVSSYSLEQLQALDAGARFTADGGRTFPWRARGVTIPSLRQVLQLFPSTPFVIELKTATVQTRVLEVIREENAADRTVLASFDPRAVHLLRAVGLKTGASQPELFSMFARASLWLPARHCAFDAVFLPRTYYGVTLPVRPALRATAPLGIAVHTWVENNPHTARRLWRSGVSGIVTDDPGTLARVRELATSDISPERDHD
jgi:glycerophosphoryl diester phosphodiesterase